MEGLAVSSFAPPAGLLGWLGWTALHAIFSRAASVPSVSSQPYCVFVFTGCKPEGKNVLHFVFGRKRAAVSWR